MLVAAILAVAVAIAPGAGSKPLAVSDTVQLVNEGLSQLDARRSVTGNGATLVFAPSGNGSTMTRYDGRPNGGTFAAQGSAISTEAVVSAGGETSFALMASSEGQLVELPYAGGTTTAWPTCTSFTLVVGSGPDTQTVTVSCSEAGQGG